MSGTASAGSLSSGSSVAPSLSDSSPENWRAATSYVLRAERPGDCVAFYPLDGKMPFAYYAGQPVRPYVERYEMPEVPSRCARVWLVASHQGQAHGPAASRAHYDAWMALRADLARPYPRHTVTSFGYASVIWVELFEP